MKWSDEAEKAIKKVPFFVRKKVRKRVEKEAAEAGKNKVTLEEVKGTQNRFLSNMSSEIKGYQLDACFGPGGCPNSILDGNTLLKRIEKLLVEEDLLGFLQRTVTGPLKFHHEFRITVSECPNACSQPQIKDIGIIGASVPTVKEENECTHCEACVDNCQEDAISLNIEKKQPEIDMGRCLYCGKCMAVCPESVLQPQKKGYRIQLGGKLGRHPVLAKELDGIFSEDGVCDVVKKCLKYYKENSSNGKRFADLLQENANSFHLFKSS